MKKRYLTSSLVLFMTAGFLLEPAISEARTRWRSRSVSFRAGGAGFTYTRATARAYPRFTRQAFRYTSRVAYPRVTRRVARRAVSIGFGLPATYYTAGYWGGYSPYTYTSGYWGWPRYTYTSSYWGYPYSYYDPYYYAGYYPYYYTGYYPSWGGWGGWGGGWW